ncbi:conserved hypothetical protein [Flavobacterium psychrophilum]|uniref:hypothetical protein n=1 Tax=Flavobacterium psychrophilum TaxID=96345 RepID=UPI00073EBC9C|nr:hypothetical protein [Flavobacterium psychrophilum]SNB18609.1 conserved hypothetical protein [Flavobacterium psychrophilum]SNB22905.1 conserved hypothetical protein [Flavobacterium psychrophilum]SNB96285.1 conserved hypothetical protein [Flavobacterium psychrophilum]GAQ49457.1 hypothetical protein FPK15_contig00040-0005 [Flavobacterium psychrophilum]GEJ29194.1 hypothetical protein FPN182_contig00117-0004 [Flavobacterium psychrophilum]
MEKFKKTIIAIGILCLIFGIIFDTFFAGIPSQDSSQEMLVTYDKNALLSIFLMISGIFIILFGLILKKEK